MRSASPRLLTRPFVLVFAMTFLTFLAAFQLFPTAPLRLRELGASLAESGRFLGVFTLGSAFGALVTGPLGDRLGQRRTAVLSALGFALFCGACALARKPWAIFALALPGGVVWSGLLTATMASLGHILPEEGRADGMSLYGLASPAGAMAGSSLGIAIMRTWGFPAMCAGLLGAFLVLALLALTLPPSPPSRERHPVLTLPERAVVGPCAVLLATALGYGCLSAYTAQEGVDLGFPRLLGLPTDACFLSVMALGMVGIRMIMARRGFGSHPMRHLPGMLVLAVLGLALLTALPGGLGRHALAAPLYGAGYSMVHTLVSTHVLECTHPERRGAAFGATMFAFDIGICAGSVALGGLIGWSSRSLGLGGYRVGWAACTALVLLTLPLAARLARR